MSYATPLYPGHRYFNNKGVHKINYESQPFQISVLGPLFPRIPNNLSRDSNIIIIPRHNLKFELVGIQYIDDRGKKAFGVGSVPTGSMFCIGDPNTNNKIALVEGIATGLTIRQTFGLTTYIAFNCGNLLPVAKLLSSKYSDIVIYGDDDFTNDKNPGWSKAIEAGNAINAEVLFPNFNGVNRSSGDSDFNDLIKLKSESNEIY